MPSRDLETDSTANDFAFPRRQEDRKACLDILVEVPWTGTEKIVFGLHRGRLRLG